MVFHIIIPQMRRHYKRFLLFFCVGTPRFPPKSRRVPNDARPGAPPPRRGGPGGGGGPAPPPGGPPPPPPRRRGGTGGGPGRESRRAGFAPRSRKRIPYGIQHPLSSKRFGRKIKKARVAGLPRCRKKERAVSSHTKPYPAIGVQSPSGRPRPIAFSKPFRYRLYPPFASCSAQ